MSLSWLTTSDFEIRIRGTSVGRREIERRGRDLAPQLAALSAPRGAALELPASDPAVALAWLAAAWEGGYAPLLHARATKPRVLPLPESDAWLLIATSGSTGEPKFAAFDRDAVAKSASRIARYLCLSKNDRVALLQPLDHSFGLVGQLFAALSANAQPVWASAPFPAEQARTLEDERVTVVSGVAFLLGRLSEVPFDRSSVRWVGSAGGPLANGLADRLAHAFPSALLHNQYGCTEAGPRLTACTRTEPPFHAGSVGRPIEGVELRICENGEVAFRTETSMRGYLGDEAATERAREDGFWRTGDLGQIDENGYLTIHGRTDDVVKVRGLKVSLLIVAKAIEEAGASAAIAAQVTRRGQDEPVLGALYEASDGRTVTRAGLKDRLPLEALPAVLKRVDALPRLESGKLDRKTTQALLEREFG